MSEPLVWLPFDPLDMGGAPDGLRVEVVRLGIDELPPSAAEVELVVPPYQLGAPDADLWARLPRLRVVQTLTAGVDHLRRSLPAGVVLCNGRGIHDTSTAELALTLTLAALRGVPDHVRNQDRATWRPQWGRSLADRQVLIVGYGQIGAAVESRLAPFECDVVRVARRPRDGVHGIDELEALLPNADVVILLVPATAATAGLVDARFIERMKDGALLVNLARGSVAVTDDLVAALEAGRISAAIDVVDPEPLPADHPLWRAPNLLVTPHVGGASSALWPRAHRLVRDQLRRYAAGEQLANVITGDY